MNRQIKFRGRVEQNDKFDGGKIVYGALVIYAGGLSTHWIYPVDGDRNGAQVWRVQSSSSIGWRPLLAQCKRVERF